MNVFPQSPQCLPIVPVPPHLSVGLLRLLPADHHGVAGDDAGLDVAGRAGGRLLPGAGLHPQGGQALADAVEGRHADLVVGVGVQAPDAVARGGDAVHRLVLAVGGLGAVLDDVVGDGVRVARVPGDGDAGGRGLRDDGGAGGLGQSFFWGGSQGETGHKDGGEVWDHERIPGLPAPSSLPGGPSATQTRLL